LLENDFNQMRLFNALLLSLPGSPVLYYGDEIGMGDVIWLGDRDGVRTAMQDSPPPTRDGCSYRPARTPSTATRRSMSRRSETRRRRCSTGRAPCSQCGVATTHSRWGRFRNW